MKSKKDGTPDRRVKLSDDQVREIRKIKGLDNQQIANLYGVGRPVISMIRRGLRRTNV